MPLPSGATFNELDGEEVKAILIARFRDKLDSIPYLQRHLTLPRVEMITLIQLKLWADQPTPEVHEISDSYTINVSPTPGGHPPDQVRDDHGLPLHTQVKVAHLPFHADVSMLDGKVVESIPGLRVDRTGTAALPGSTFVTMDQGPAGLARGGSRDALGIFKNENRK